MKDFNNRFKHPLRWNVIESDTRNVERKQYYYRSETILEHQGIEPDEEILMDLKGIVSKTEYKRRDNEANKKRQKYKYRNEEGLTKTEVKRRNEFINIARLELEGLSRKLKKVYNKINYLEILEEVKVELDDDKERVRESR